MLTLFSFQKQLPFAGKALAGRVNALFLHFRVCR